MQTVGELMTRELVTLEETQQPSLAEELLRRHRIRHLPVVRGGKLVGLITHWDLLRAEAQGSVDPARRPRTVAEIMARDVATVSPDTPTREALSMMLQNKYDCLPVVGPQEELLGILTEADLVRFAQHLIEDLDRRSLAAEFEA